MKKLFTLLLLILPVRLFAQSVAYADQNSLTGLVFDVVITEIMADPDPPMGLPNQEYCEIFNRSSLPIDLSGWIFFDGSSREMPSIVIEPGEYIIICDDADTSLFSGFGKYAAISSISLTNTGEKIALRNALGLPIDSVIFSDEWYAGTYKKDGGWSLEKVDADFTCPVSSNWMSSENPTGGTPGSVNSIAGTIEDYDPPVLLRSYCPDSVSVVLLFSEPLDPDEAISISHYWINQLSNPAQVMFYDATLFSIILTLADPIVVGLPQSVTVTGLSDCSGNLILEGSISRFGISDTSLPENLVINEVLFNPPDNGYDFVELFNNGNQLVDLSRLTLESLDIETGETELSNAVSDVPLLLFPGDYLALSENPKVVSQQYKTSYPFSFLIPEDFPAMNIDEGYIAITYGGIRIDAFHYYESFHFELLDDKKGISLERIHPKFPSGEPGSWHSAAESAGFATPGLKNSQYSELNAFGDVTLSPEIFSPDMDGIDDFITITLQPGKPGYIENMWIYNSEGQIVYEETKNKLLGTRDAISWDGIISSGTVGAPGIYIAMVMCFNLEGVVKKYKLPFVLATRL